MLHQPSYTPSQLAARQHQQQFRKAIVKKIPIAGLLQSQVVPIARLDEPEPFGPIVHPPASEWIPTFSRRNSDDVFGPVVHPRRQLTVHDIARAVCSYFSIDMTDMLSDRRQGSIVLPRQVTCYLAKTLTLRSLPAIGERLGRRDHTTILHAVRKIEAMRSRDWSLEKDLQNICADLRMPLRHAFPPNEAHHATVQRRS